MIDLRKEIKKEKVAQESQEKALPASTIGASSSVSPRASSVIPVSIESSTPPTSTLGVPIILGAITDVAAHSVSLDTRD